MKANRLALIGIVLGFAGAALLALFVARAGDDAPATETATVIVAGAGGVPAGTTGEALSGLVEVREVPVDVVPERAVAGSEDLVGQRASRVVGPGEIITADQFGAPGPSTGGVIVEEGWEAITVEAAPAPGLEGYATTGSLVNLYLTATEPAAQPVAVDPAAPADPQSQARQFTQLVMAHTEVLAVTRGTLTGEAQQVPEGQAGPSGVFLLKVRTEDVPTLVFAEQQGEIWFTLTNEDDPAPTAERFFFEDLDPAAVNQSIAEARTALEESRAAREAAEAAQAAADAETAQAPADAQDGS